MSSASWTQNEINLIHLRVINGLVQLLVSKGVIPAEDMQRLFEQLTEQLACQDNEGRLERYLNVMTTGVPSLQESLSRK